MVELQFEFEELLERHDVGVQPGETQEELAVHLEDAGRVFRDGGQLDAQAAVGGDCDAAVAGHCDDAAAVVVEDTLRNKHGTTGVSVVEKQTFVTRGERMRTKLTISNVSN